MGVGLRWHRSMFTWLTPQTPICYYSYSHYKYTDYKIWIQLWSAASAERENVDLLITVRCLFEMIDSPLLCTGHLWVHLSPICFCLVLYVLAWLITYQIVFISKEILPAAHFSCNFLPGFWGRTRLWKLRSCRPHTQLRYQWLLLIMLHLRTHTHTKSCLKLPLLLHEPKHILDPW